MVTNLLESKCQNLLSEMWQEACERGKNLSFKIVSGSMSPLLEEGNVVRVGRAEATRVRVGDIIAFKDGRNVVVHRVIGRISKDGKLVFRHRGDAGESSGIISAENLIGKILVIEKEGHRIFLDSRRYIVNNMVFGWRLVLVDIIGRMNSRFFSFVMYRVLRPVWKLCRRLICWRL